MSNVPISTLSDFNVEVVRIGEITKHPNADTLSVTTALGNPVVIKTPNWRSFSDSGRLRL